MDCAPIDPPFVAAFLNCPVGRIPSLGRGGGRIVVRRERIGDEAVDGLSDGLWRTDDRCGRSPQTPIRIRRTHPARRAATTDERTRSAFLGGLRNWRCGSRDRGWYRSRSSHMYLARLLCATLA